MHAPYLLQEVQRPRRDGQNHAQPHRNLFRESRSLAKIGVFPCAECVCLGTTSSRKDEAGYTDMGFVAWVLIEVFAGVASLLCC